MTDVHITRTLYDRLTGTGFEPSEDAQRLYRAMTTGPTPDEALDKARTQLKTAMLAGDAEEIRQAQAAVTEAGNVQGAWADYRAMRTDYATRLLATIADDAFTHARALYNKAGLAFAKALATVNPDADASEVMTGGTKAERDAWASIPRLTAALDARADLLGDVVRFCGRTAVCGNYRYTDPKAAAFPLGLLVSPGDASPKLLHHVWRWIPYRPEHVNPRPPTELDLLCSGNRGGSSWGRGGRWAALVRAGATLHATATNMDAYQPLSDGKKRETVGGVGHGAL